MAKISFQKLGDPAPVPVSGTPCSQIIEKILAKGNVIETF
jgi:hypothetical protein